MSNQNQHPQTHHSSLSHPHSTHSSQSSQHSHNKSAAARNRQYTHLQSQLSQLNAHLADTENLLAMTAAQAEYLEGLAGWWGGLFISASKVLGEGDLSDHAVVVAGAERGEGKEKEKTKADSP